MLEFLQWSSTMLFLFVAFIGPYYVLVRRFFSRVSKIEAFLYGFVLSSFMKLVFFAISVMGFINIQYSLLIETLIFAAISVYIAYQKKMWRELEGNIRKVSIFLACFLLLSCFVFFFSVRYGWDSDEVYLAYAKVYYEENRLVGFSPEISNYLSVQPLTSIIYTWIFCLTGLHDLNTFFLPIVAFVANVLGIYTMSRKYLKIDGKLVLIVTAMNLALVASLISVPRYADLFFSALSIIFFNLLLSGQEKAPNYGICILLTLTLTTAIYCKVLAFGLYFLILLLIVPKLRFSYNKFKYAVLPLIWVPFLYISTFVMPVSNITVPEVGQSFFQISVIIFLSLLSIAYIFIVKSSAANTKRKSKTKVKVRHFIVFFILLVLLSVPYFYYEYSMSGTIFFPYVKAPSMSASQDLLLQTSKEIGRVESTPISVLYLLVSPGIWLFLPFFFLAVFSSAYRILSNKTKKKDIFTFQVLVFSVLFLLMDYSSNMAVRIRHQIPFFILYQIICILGFSELLDKFGLSTRSWKLVYATLFSAHVLLDFTRIHTELPTSNQALSLATSGAQIIILSVLVLLVILDSKTIRGVKRKFSVEWIRKISSVLRGHWIKAGCLSVLLISLLTSSSSIVTYLESYSMYANPQKQMMEALQVLPASKIMTFGVAGGYYYRGHQYLGISYVESLSLIYPTYTQNLTAFIRKLIDMNISYVVLPSSKSFFFTEWYESIAKRIPVLNVFKSKTLFPLVQHLDMALFDIRYFNTTALPSFFDTPHLLHAKAAGEFIVPDLIGDEPLDYWPYVGRSQTVTLSFNVFLPKGYDLIDISVDANEAFYFHNDTVIRQNVVLECTTQKDLEDLFTITTNITGVDVEGLHWYTVQIPKVTLILSCETSNKCSLVLVSSSEKPLTLWYTPSTNEWSLEEGTYPFRELFVKD